MHHLKSTAAKIALIIVIGSSVALPLAASAAANGTWTMPSLWPTGYWAPNGLISCTGNYLASNSGPQCTDLCDLLETVINVLYFGMTIALFVIAPLMFVVGGIMLLMAGASPEMISAGKKALTATVIGIVIVLCAYLIVNTVVTILNISGVGGFNAASCSVSS
ncbi:MAG TPA: pilin [Candidatus Paceibacterota bacterium]|nr:pilin [Candidatus Paceibacterota bacterium]